MYRGVVGAAVAAVDAAAEGLAGAVGAEWVLGVACCIVIRLRLCRGVLLAGGVAAGVAGALVAG